MLNLPWKLIGAAMAALALVATVWAHFANDTAVREERDAYSNRLSTIRLTFKDDGGIKVTAGKEVSGLKLIIRQRNEARADKALADRVIDNQSDSIAELESRTKALAAKAKRAWEEKQNTIRERDMWARRAREAATRTEQLSAQEEVEQCNSTLNRLRLQGF